jgi:hypothetical protein
MRMLPAEIGCPDMCCHLIELENTTCGVGHTHYIFYRVKMIGTVLSSDHYQRFRSGLEHRIEGFGPAGNHQVCLVSLSTIIHLNMSWSKRMLRGVHFKVVNRRWWQDSSRRKLSSTS